MCASAIWPTAAAAWDCGNSSGPPGKLQFAPAERNGARGDEHDFLAASAQAQQVLDQGAEPAPVDLSVVITSSAEPTLTTMRRARVRGSDLSGVDLTQYLPLPHSQAAPKLTPLHQEA